MVSVTKVWNIERCYFWPQIQLTEMFGQLFLLITAGRQREFLTS